MKKKISENKIGNFEKDIGIFLGLGGGLGVTFGIISNNFGLWISLGIAFGVCGGFIFAIIKNYEELAKKARAKR